MSTITFIPQPAGRLKLRRAGRLKLRRRHNGRHWTWVCAYTEAYANILCGSARTWDDAVAMGLRALALRKQP